MSENAIFWAPPKLLQIFLNSTWLRASACFLFINYCTVYNKQFRGELSPALRCPPPPFRNHAMRSNPSKSRKCRKNLKAALEHLWSPLFSANSNLLTLKMWTLDRKRQKGRPLGLFIRFHHPIAFSNFAWDNEKVILFSQRLKLTRINLFYLLNCIKLNGHETHKITVIKTQNY